MLSAREVEELRHAVNIVKGAIHPDTQQPIPMPMRITFFIPGNIPIAAGMIFSSPTMFNTLFWQIANQTYNAVLNLGNANKSSPITTNDIMMSYFAAVGASCAAGYTIRKATAGLLAKAKGG
jgi:sideroflexin-5